MIRKSHFPVISLAWVLLLAGCNNDVFIDGPAIPDFSETTIEGDGGEASFSIPVKKLQYIDIDSPGIEYSSYLTYYDADGNIISHTSPADMVGRIRYESDFVCFEVSKKGNTLSVLSICNATTMPGYWRIHLQYDFGPKSINIITHPGQPPRLVSVEHWTPMENPEAKKKVSRVRVESTSPNPLPVTLYPFQDAPASLCVDPLENNWLKNVEVTLPLPVYENGEWTLREMSGIRPGESYYFDVDNKETEVTISWPGQTFGYIVTEVNYSGVEISGTMTFENEILSRTLVYPYTAKAFHPTDFHITLTEDTPTRIVKK